MLDACNKLFLFVITPYQQTTLRNMTRHTTFAFFTGERRMHKLITYATKETLCHAKVIKINLTISIFICGHTNFLFSQMLDISSRFTIGNVFLAHVV